MSDKNIEKKQHAQLLYISQGKSHAQIAEEVGVTERTVFNWVHQYAWDKLRLAAYQAPVSIADSLCSEIVELQQDIALREVGKRYPTPQESMTMQRMISCLEKMKKYPSLSQNMQILENFKNYIKPLDNDFAKDLGRYTNRYLTSAAQNGFVPYQLEYGVDAAPPIAPYYEDEEECEILEVPRRQPDSPVTYSISSIHHARPYIIPLLNICRDQVMEELFHAGQDEKVTADFIEKRYGRANKTEESPETSGTDPESAGDFNNPFLGQFSDQANHGAHEISGNNPETNGKSENTISDITLVPSISGSDEISGSNPETSGKRNNTISAIPTIPLISGSDNEPVSEDEAELQMMARQRWQTLLSYLMPDESDDEYDALMSKAS